MHARTQARRRRRAFKKRKEPPFAIAAAVVGIAATAYGVANTVQQTRKANAASRQQGTNQQTSTSTTRSGQVYPEDALTLYRGYEAPTLAGALGQQQQVLEPFWTGGTPGMQDLAGQYGSAPVEAVNTAITGGAKQAGIRDTSAARMQTLGLPPVLMGALQNLALQNAAQRTSVIPAGYQNFFAPGQTAQTTTSGTNQQKSTRTQDIDPMAAGFQLAQGTLGLGSAIYKAI